MDVIDEVKQRLSIEDVIGEYVELKRAGRNFRGLSPFQNEKTPSFMVSPEKQIWHDFSSGKGGNIFSFIMEMEGLDFKEALEMLARKAGVDLNQYRGQKNNTKHKERLYECLEQATIYYQKQLKNNNQALKYLLKDREFSKDIVLRFRIGYSPNESNSLSRYLLNKNFTAKEIKQAGLSNDYNGQIRDMFRGRIMVPLMDSFGKVIGFTARLLIDNPKAPKYINTPQTILYDKSRHIYGMHLAKESIRKNNFAVIVEGNMDVIASHQADVINTVATAGTAMTLQHLKEIARFSNDIRLCFDQDQAGLNATERTILLAAGLDIKLNIITISGGKDPDELIRYDAHTWKESINNFDYAFDWLISRYAKAEDLSTGVGKKSFIDKVTPLINKISNAVEKEHYKKLIAKMVDIDYTVLNRQGVIDKPKMQLKKGKNITVAKKSYSDVSKIVNQYLSLLLVHPSLRVYTNFVTPQMLKKEEAIELYQLISKHPKDKAAEITLQTEGVQILEDYVKIITLLYEELYAHLEFVDLQDETARLQVRIIENYIKKQKIAITSQLKSEKDELLVTELLVKAKKLDYLLKSAKEAASGK